MSVPNAAKISAKFEELKDLLVQLKPDSEAKLEKLGNDPDALSSKSKLEKLNAPLNRVGWFLKKLGDEKSDYNKLLKGSKTGLDLFQKAGRSYNKVAMHWVCRQYRESFSVRRKSNQ
ncbi:MAG: hypothetical protein GY940_26370, partial [bacterium]|nr:hypothetical protein [bacterium]